MTSAANKNTRGYAATIVSLLPYKITETKPHMLPFTFVIPEADKEHGLSVTHVEQGLHFIPNHFDEKQNYRQVTPPMEMARSLVEDYANSLIVTDEAAGPGLFYVDGRYEADEIAKVFPDELAKAKARQDRWFRNLVELADSDWESTKNYRAVSDLQRYAARYLSVKRAWVDPIPTTENTCPFCKAVVDPTSIKCFNCKEVINAVAYKKMQEQMGVSV